MIHAPLPQSLPPPMTRADFARFKAEAAALHAHHHCTGKCRLMRLIALVEAQDERLHDCGECDDTCERDHTPPAVGGVPCPAGCTASLMPDYVPMHLRECRAVQARIVAAAWRVYDNRRDPDAWMALFTVLTSPPYDSDGQLLPLPERFGE